MQIEIINFSDIIKDKNLTLSAKFHINRKRGKKPYIQENELYRPAKTSEYDHSKVKYFTDKQVTDTNRILQKQININKTCNEIITKIENDER